MYSSTNHSKSVFLVACLLLVGVTLPGCDNSGSNSGTTYEFEGMWKHEGGGSWGGGGYEHYLDVSGKNITKHQVSLDVDGNRIGCDTDKQKIKSYDESTNTVTLDGALHSDGPTIEIAVDSGSLTYTPEGEDADNYQETDALPSGAKSRCG